MAAVDELTDPDSALAGAPVHVEEDVGRAAATITAWNLVSRLTGFARVLATAAALGIAALGDTYQSANLVSNILFELLAGGLLFSVLIPTFVGMIDGGQRDRASAVASVLLARALVGLAALAAGGVLAGPWIMRVLTLGVAETDQRELQIRLGGFLLWFVMPQLLLYAAGAVASALLQAERRFSASAAAPVCNNVVVIVTMVVFAAVHDPAHGLALTAGEKAILGGGTLLGTVALTALPMAALRRSGFVLRPRWSDPQATGLAAVARKGAWGAGSIGLNQVLVAATVIYASRVEGGVIAYQTAFTFFLLPHALLAHPIFTALFPRMSAHGRSGDMAAFADDVVGGIRAMVILVVPAAGLLAIVAHPLLTLARFGELDADGARLVSSVLAAYMAGLVGYSAFFLLTRACYALDDVRSPTVANLAVTAGAILVMAVTSNVVDGRNRVVVLGMAHGVAVSLGSVALFLHLRRRSPHPMVIGPTMLRAALGTLIACAVGYAVVRLIGSDDRAHALAASSAAGLAGVACYGAVLGVLQAPELDQVVDRIRPDRVGRRSQP
ncbi:MAG: lipid II flippase MurJ [Acidimicrobiales bacterium]